MFLNLRCAYILLLVLPLLFNSCAGIYFRDAGKPPMPPPQFELSDWPYKEYWTGIVFNGAKIGFSRFELSLSPSAPDLTDIHSEAVMRFNFLSFDKKINLKSYDQVAQDLSLKQFKYEYDLDENRLKLNGRLEYGKLEVNVETNGQQYRQTIPVADKIYPTSIINLYPLMHGLEVGRVFTYMVYDGETQTVSPVEQRVLAFEESDLYIGRAFKIKTRLHGQEVTTWMDTQGRPLLEMSMGGVIISALESKSAAMQYLAQAAVNKADALLDFSLIKSDIPIQDPTQLKFMEVALSGINGSLSVPDDNRQVCRRKEDEIICKIDSSIPDRQSLGRRQLHKSMQQYLQSSYIIPSNDRRIRQTAEEIVTKAGGRQQQIVALVDWIRENIQQKLVDVFTALDVLDNRKAECQGHAFLYAAFARSLNIPTRVVNGIVYSVEYQGFLYHTWAESQVNGYWIAIDPTFRQVPADATHIKLVEGENVADLIPLVSLIGKIKMRVIQTE